MKISQNMGHPVLLCKELRAKPIKQRRFGVDLVFWRDAHNNPQAFADRCPHLGASLNQGTVVAGRLVCPSQWLLNISGNFKNFIAFVPIDTHNTRFYLRVCHKVKVPLLRHVYEFFLQIFNKIILHQDLTIITHLTPDFSLDATADRLIGADRAVSAYRKWLTTCRAEFSIPASESAAQGHRTIPVAIDKN